MADTGIVNIHGKAYETVALRVKKFRDGEGKALALTTEIITRDEDCVVMKATISVPGGAVLATGHSEEYRQSSSINKTSALENAETSAIGRALAAFGMGGTEFASADEVARAVSGAKGTITPTTGARDRVKPDRRRVVEDTAILIKDALAEAKDFDAFGFCEDFTDADEKVYLWSFLDSKERRRLQTQANVAKGVTA